MQEPVAVIDIGSNSVRLVVYSGSARAPAIIFNEKVLAGLGKGLNKSGRLSSDAQDRALDALARFAVLVRKMGIRRVRTVATAAVRDAANGGEFVASVRRLGLRCDVLSADEEARLAGEGVASAFPGADGIVGDLGGGSLELVELSQGEVRHGVSVPLGVLRVRRTAAEADRIATMIREAVRDAGFQSTSGRRFYMVGGSWRSLARLDMLTSSYPLPITHAYAMAPSRPGKILELIDALGGKLPKSIPISAERLPTLPAAGMILEQVAAVLRPSQLVVSSYGIREGMLYSDLARRDKPKDPLIEAARDASLAQRRFEEHGDELDAWIAPIFDDRPAVARLRLASCILADAAWQAHPDFRAERGVEMALHGNWVGVNAAERVLLAQALYSNFGAPQLLPDKALAALCAKPDLQRALEWGLAMRLGQRLCGGVAAALRDTGLSLKASAIRLSLSSASQALAGEIVERRLARLANAMGLRHAIDVAG